MFLKYPSIENSYQHKYIQKWLDKYPELARQIFVGQEKIHGANIQLASDGKDFIVASRNQIIKQGEKFQKVDVYDLINTKYPSIKQYLLHFAYQLGKIVRIYGELCGPKIQKGVDYGEVQIRIFDISIRNKFLPAREIYKIFRPQVAAPIIFKANGLEQALEKDIQVSSKICNKPNNIIEGVVIKPFFNVYQEQELFYLKRKNDLFIEKQKEKKPPKDNTIAAKYNRIFRQYITRNRLQNIFSKYGEIERPQQIGQYLQYILEDAKEDFLKENELPDMDKKELKQVYNVGSLAANMLKEHL